MNRHPASMPRPHLVSLSHFIPFHPTPSHPISFHLISSSTSQPSRVLEPVPLLHALEQAAVVDAADGLLGRHAVLVLDEQPRDEPLELGSEPAQRKGVGIRSGDGGGAGRRRRRRAPRVIHRLERSWDAPPDIEAQALSHELESTTVPTHNRKRHFLWQGRSGFSLSDPKNDAPPLSFPSLTIQRSP